MKFSIIALAMLCITARAAETNKLAQAEYMATASDAGIVVLVSTNPPSYVVLLSVDRQWKIYKASVRDNRVVNGHLGRPVQITAKVLPKLNMIEGIMFDIISVEILDAEQAGAGYPPQGVGSPDP